MRKLTQQAGYSLIELIVVLVIIGIIAGVSLKSLQTAGTTARVERTRQELDKLAEAMVGNPKLVSGGMRTDYGYVGDVGNLPPSLDALVSNPGLATWDGPYIQDELTLGGAETDFKFDAWGHSYAYSGGVTIASTGGGLSMTRQLANSATDLLRNRVSLSISDLDGTPPGLSYRDSVRVLLSYPNGLGGLATVSRTPRADGFVEFDSVPIGVHALRMVYLPTGDTLRRDINVGPGQDFRTELQHFENVWTAGTSAGCSGAGTLVLRPVNNGSVTQLSRSSCSQNWECVSEVSADGNGTHVYRAASSWAYDYYRIQDSADADCSISAVRIHANASRSLLSAYIRLDIQTHGNTYNGSSQSLGTSWNNYSQEWTTNPSTGDAWTWSEVQDLQVRLQLDGGGLLFPAYCTQVWVEVDYGP